jgi:hypothetical protein
MDSMEIIETNKSSMKITRNFKGEMGYEVKAYGDTVEEINSKVTDMKAKAEAQIR